MSWAAYMNTAGDPPDTWTTNVLRFATESEAKQYARQLRWRWTAVLAYMVSETTDPVNYRFDDRLQEAIPLGD